MKIAVVQIYNDNIKTYAEYSRLINSIYAHKQGYEYICWEYDLVPLEYSVYYNKILAIHQALKCNMNFDWILYLDSDAIVTNINIRIEDIIAQHPGKEIIYARDKNGANNGVALIKNTPMMLDYLQECFTAKQYFHTQTPEQAAMIFTAMSDKYKDKLGWETMQFFNGYLKKYKNMPHDEPVWNDESFILHLQRYPNKERCRIFRKILDTMHIHCIVKENI